MDGSDGRTAAAPAQHRLTEGPITSTLFWFSLPVLGSNVLQSLNGSVNAVWVGQFLGEAGLTATANANLVLFLMLGAVFGVGMAANIMVAQAVGAKDLDQAKRIVGTSAAFFVIASLAVALAGFLATPSILRWLAERVSVSRVALGSDYSFPPADNDPVATVKAAGFSAAEIKAIVEDNPRDIFPKLS